MSSRARALGLRERPVDVLAQQRRRIVAPRSERIAQRRIRCAAQCVADRDREVALPALVADAPDRAAFGAAQELVLAPAEQLDQPPPRDVVAPLARLLKNSAAVSTTPTFSATATAIH